MPKKKLKKSDGSRARDNHGAGASNRPELNWSASIGSFDTFLRFNGIGLDTHFSISKSRKTYFLYSNLYGPHVTGSEHMRRFLKSSDAQPRPPSCLGL